VHLLNEEAARLERGILQGRALALVLVDVGAPLEGLTAALTDEQHAAVDGVDVVCQRGLAAEGFAALLAAVWASPRALGLVLCQEGPADEGHVAHVALVGRALHGCTPRPPSHGPSLGLVHGV